MHKSHDTLLGHVHLACCSTGGTTGHCTDDEAMELRFILQVTGIHWR
jgi:hypothetical protein